MEYTSAVCGKRESAGASLPGTETTAPAPTILTRAQLYDLVWTTPISRLAKSFDLSDVSRAKICAKHKVPRPTRASGPSWNTARLVQPKLFRG